MVYYYIYVFFSVYAFLYDESHTKSKHITYLTKFLIISSLFILVFIVINNPITTDMIRYLRAFQEYQSISLFKAVSSTRWEPGFVTYQWLVSKLFTNDYLFIIISVIIIWIIKIITLRKVFELNEIAILLVGYLSLFYYYNFYRNILRQGFAISLVLSLIIYLYNDDYKKAVIIFFLSISFHYSSVVAISLFFIKKMKLSLEKLLSLFIFSFVLMLAGLNRKIVLYLLGFFEGAFIEIIEQYSQGSMITKYGSSNRLDFLVFTTFWILYGYFFYRRYLNEDKLYTWIMKIYITFSIVFTTLGFISYSDRIAAYAWSLIPIIMVYPLFKIDSRFKNKLLIMIVSICIAMIYFFDTNVLYNNLF